MTEKNKQPQPQQQRQWQQYDGNNGSNNCSQTVVLCPWFLCESWSERKCARIHRDIAHKKQKERKRSKRKTEKPKHSKEAKLTILKNNNKRKKKSRTHTKSEFKHCIAVTQVKYRIAFAKAGNFLFGSDVNASPSSFLLLFYHAENMYIITSQADS